MHQIEQRSNSKISHRMILFLNAGSIMAKLVRRQYDLLGKLQDNTIARTISAGPLASEILFLRISPKEIN